MHDSRFWNQVIAFKKIIWTNVLVDGIVRQIYTTKKHMVINNYIQWQQHMGATLFFYEKQLNWPEWIFKESFSEYDNAFHTCNVNIN